MTHHAYILECADGSLYAGSTNDLAKRLVEHNAGKRGAKYTHSRRPVKLVFKKRFLSFAKSRAYEAEIKRMTREEKLRLIGR